MEHGERWEFLRHLHRPLKELFARQAISREDGFHQFSANIGEPIVSPLMSKGEPLVVDPEAMEQGRIEIVNVDSIPRNTVGKIIRLSPSDSRLHTSSGKPHRKTSAMVVPPVVVCL